MSITPLTSSRVAACLRRPRSPRARRAGAAAWARDRVRRLVRDGGAAVAGLAAMAAMAVVGAGYGVGHDPHDRARGDHHHSAEHHDHDHHHGDDHDHAAGHAHDQDRAHDDAAPRFWTNRTGLELPRTEEDDAFVFAVFGDRTGGPAEGVEVLADAVRDVTLFDPDLVMTVGDLIQGYGQEDAWMREMREYRAIMDELTCPWFPVAGNHDTYWRGPNRPENEHEDNYERHFGPLWYAFEHKDCLFMALYTDEGNPETGERNFRKPNCQRMSPEQFAWMQETLAEHRDKRHVFVFLHHPRWIGGNYGDDWERVHRALVDAGNVRAVFAGHIHHMRSDPRDGIEYVTLATVGAHQPGLVPDAGWLHHYHIVTVRDDRLSMAAVPVGEVLDVRAITGDLTAQLQRAAEARPRVAHDIELEGDGGASGMIELSIQNPTDFPMDVTVLPDSRDARWFFGPDHDHHRIAPGGTWETQLRAARTPGPIDRHTHLPELRVVRDVLATGRRLGLPEHVRPLDVSVDLPADAIVSAPLRHAVFDGRDDHLRIASGRLDLPDGPCTLEVWCRPERTNGRRGLVCKTEQSGYGIFVSNGIPSFFLHVGGGYAEVAAPAAMLERGRWHHIAGVFDGSEVRLYVDGALIARRAASGERRRNELPLIVGGDVSVTGDLTSPFEGAIDAVRLSRIARYTGDTAAAERAFQPDAETILLLPLDGRFGPWAPDRSGRHAHAVIAGAPTFEQD